MKEVTEVISLEVERQGRTTYRTIGFRSGTQLGGRIADPNNRDDFILAAGCIAHHKLNRFQLDPYQCTFLQWGLNKVCVREDEPHGLLEQLMECHRHSHLTRLLLNSPLFLLSPTLHLHLLTLSFLLISSTHVTFILSYSSLHVHYLTFLIFLSNALDMAIMTYRIQEEWLSTCTQEDGLPRPT